MQLSFEIQNIQFQPPFNVIILYLFHLLTWSMLQEIYLRHVRPWQVPGILTDLDQINHFSQIP